MRIVIQRVKEASVAIDGKTISQIAKGLMVLVGIVDDDNDNDIEWLCSKIVNMRIFDDADGVMNNPITAIDGASILVVSQFTLMASTRKGNRPSYIKAARPEVAIPIYKRFLSSLEQSFGKPILTGRFGANMQVSLINDGPVTIIVDSKERQ